MAFGKRDYRHHEGKKVKKDKQKPLVPEAVLPHAPEPEVIPKGKAAKKREEES